MEIPFRPKNLSGLSIFTLFLICLLVMSGCNANSGKNALIGDTLSRMEEPFIAFTALWQDKKLGIPAKSEVSGDEISIMTQTSDKSYLAEKEKYPEFEDVHLFEVSIKSKRDQYLSYLFVKKSKETGWGLLEAWSIDKNSKEKRSIIENTGKIRYPSKVAVQNVLNEFEFNMDPTEVDIAKAQ